MSLAIQPGEAYALLGPNGAGKSTAARIACGLLRPWAGTAEVAGCDLTLPGRRARVGLAPQDSALFPALTLRENLHTMARIGGVARAARSAAVERAMRLTQCLARADERVDALSGGWRRRANLAATLVCRSALLVLDEPTEGVDAATRSSLADGVKSALKDGAACLIISHDAAFVSAVADRVGVLHEGRLIAEGAAQDLLARTFGSALRLSATFALPPSAPLQRALAAQGLVGEPDGVTWRRIGDDVEDIVAALSTTVQDSGGALSVRRPDLDDLLAHLTGRRS